MNTASEALTRANTVHPSELVDLGRYPILDRDSSRYRSLIADLQETLASDRLVPMDGFLTPEGVERMLADALPLKPRAFHCVKTGNPYGIDPSEIDALPEGHPGKIMSPTHRDGVGYHDLRGSLCAALYEWPPLRRFIADIQGLPELYLHEDPSNALVLQFYCPPDGKLAWHFDRALFSTILHLQAAEDGGFFEAAPGIRDAENENHDDVQALVTGAAEAPMRRKAKPGTLTVIHGNHTLHRVTDIGGTKDRISLILAYEEQPGVKLPLYLRRIFFGPDCPAD